MRPAALENRFLLQLLADEEAGGVRTLDQYRQMFPHHAEEIEKAFLEIAAPGAPGAPMPGIGSSGPEGDATVERLGPYRLIREVGRGGQGIVYEAVDERFHRRVALKVLRGAWLPPESRRRFQREAEVASRLDHPGICTVHDAGIRDGVPYIAMRFVAGLTLNQRLAEHAAGATAKGAWRKAVGWVEKIARALHAAHENGIVHRDIKPKNVIITPDDEPVLLDFGLARVSDPDQSSLTRTGEVFGTPTYMAPEELSCQGSDFDPRSDVWSLGVTLFESVTGRRPFEAPTTEALCRAILTKSAPDPLKLNPRLPRDLRVVIATALEKDVTRRYRNARSLADDLAAVLQSRPISARPPAPWTVALRWCQREPRLAATIGVALCAVAGASALVSVRGEAATRRRARDLLAGASRLVAEFETARAALPGLAADVDREESEILRQEPVDQPKKQQLIQAREAERRGRRRVEELAAAAESALASARAVRPLPEVLSAQESFLARLYIHAESSANEAAMIRLRGLLEGTPSEGTLHPRGILSLDTEPSGARVTAFRYESAVEGCFVEDRSRPVELGVTPLRRVPLEAGSYVLSITAEGARTTRLPVLIARDEEWAAPDDRRIRLHSDAEIGGAEWIYVSPGWSLIGIHPGADSAPRLRRQWFDGIYMMRREVTNEEYAAFVNDPETLVEIRRGWREGAGIPERIPRVTSGKLFWRPCPDGTWSYVESDRYPPSDFARIPVFGVSWQDAMAYVRWKSRQDGRAYRLPDQFEWEHAARGADGRIYPWGNGFDWSFMCGKRSAPDPLRLPAGSFARDVAPTGVVDLGGSRWEWCAMHEDNELGKEAMLRGGSALCSQVFQFLCAYQNGGDPAFSFESSGLRLVCDP